MSARLFDQHQQQQQQQTTDHHPEGVPEVNSCGGIGDDAAYDSAARNATDVCEELLDSKMAALELNEAETLLMRRNHQHHQHQQQQLQKQQNYDGSDSGVDIVTSGGGPGGIGGGGGGGGGDNVTLQRALSSNSGGYTSSNGGLDETTHGLNMSCDSSMISCSSDLFELKADNGAAGVHNPMGDQRIIGGVGGSGGGSYDCCSENGSESSSAAAAPITQVPPPLRRSAMNSVKRRTAMFEMAMHQSVPSAGAMGCVARGGGGGGGPTAKEKDFPTSTTAHSSGHSQGPTGTFGRPRVSTLKRTASLPRPSAGHSGAVGTPKGTASGGRQSGVGAAAAGGGLHRYAQGRTGATSSLAAAHHHHTTAKPQKPDSLPSALSRTQSISMQRLVQRTPSLSRARTPGTPSDDGRWPSTTTNPRSMNCSILASSPVTTGGVGGKQRGSSVTPDSGLLKMGTSMMAAIDVKSNNANPYSTMPRRRKQKSVEDLAADGGTKSRSNSVCRDSRMITSTSVVGIASAATSSLMSTRRNLNSSYGSGTPSSQGKSAGSRSAAFGTRKQQPPPPPSQLSKTRIYHETGAQTVLTAGDLEKAFAGFMVPGGRSIEAAEQRDTATQSDIRDNELERLRDEVRQLAQREHELSIKLQREREEKLAMQRELHLNTERVMGMLEMARAGAGTGVSLWDGSVSGGGVGVGVGGDCGGHDSLLMLESQIQLSGHELIERQNEIRQLREVCRSLQMAMQRSLAAQECLLQEKVAIEMESSELQDFLQNEKAAMCDALKEIESDLNMCKHQLASRDEEVKVLRDECRHLVRLNEQRRQENRMLQTKYSALENKSRELIAQQNVSVVGASSALNGLHTRLDHLVEQLVASYNISETDLEDIGFQSEAQTQNCSTSNDCDSNQTTKQLSTNNGNDQEMVTSSSSADRSGQQQQQQQSPEEQEQQQLAAGVGAAAASDGSLSPQRNQSFIAAVISAIRNATTPSGKRLLSSHQRGSGGSGAGGVINGASHKQRNNVAHQNGIHPHQHQNLHHHQQQQLQQQPYNSSSNNNTSYYNDHGNNGSDSDSTEMLDSETEPCLMMDNVLEDVTMPDSHSHNMVSSCSGMISQIEIPSEVINVTTADESLHNLSQAIVNRQQLELHLNAITAHKVIPALQLNPNENSISEDMSCHDSVAEMPSLVEYSTSAQSVVDQVIEVDGLVTKLLKVLRLIQMDNDNCIQQLIVDKNKLQQNKEDMLEKLKDLNDANVKLRDELMDATQEIMLKTNDLSSAKSEIQRHRNEIDRLTEDVCNLSTLCSNYKKLSPMTEFPPMFPTTVAAANHAIGIGSDTDGKRNNSSGDDDDDANAIGILNLLRIWYGEGQLNDKRVRTFLADIFAGEKALNHVHAQRRNTSIDERLRIYANQLENVLRILDMCTNDLDVGCKYPALLQLRKDIEIVKLNADWNCVVDMGASTLLGNQQQSIIGESLQKSIGDDINANDE